METDMRKRRTVGEWVEARYSTYDPKIHQVFINDVPASTESLNKPLCPLDEITFQNKLKPETDIRRRPS
jgi:hypothetical protein